MIGRSFIECSMPLTKKQVTTPSSGSYRVLSTINLNTQESGRSSQHTRRWESPPSEQVLTESAPSNVVYCAFESAPQPKVRPGLKRISELIGAVESTEAGRARMVNARRAIGRRYYSNATSIIARYRLQAGLSQKQLAEAINTSQSHIARIESGRDLQVQTLAKIADALGVDRGELASEVARTI